MTICKNCGAALDDSIRFCTRCGIRLDAPPPAPEAPVYAQAPEIEKITEAETIPETEKAPAPEGLTVDEILAGTEKKPEEPEDRKEPEKPESDGSTSAADGEAQAAFAGNIMPERKAPSREEPFFAGGLSSQAIPPRGEIPPRGAVPPQGPPPPPQGQWAPPPAPGQGEKMFFGKGALIFCLVIIGLLSISTGVFAGLYFSLLR